MRDEPGSASGHEGRGGRGRASGGERRPRDGRSRSPSRDLRPRARAVPRYAWNGLVMSLFAWIPGVPGIAARAIAYRLILRARGLPAIESHVRVRRPGDITLGARVFVDADVLLRRWQGEACVIGDDSMVMRGCTLQVYNHRALLHAGISLGRRTFVGEHTLMRGQGGITIGDNVLFGPGVQVLAVNHVTHGSDRADSRSGHHCRRHPHRRRLLDRRGRNRPRRRHHRPRRLHRRRRRRHPIDSSTHPRGRRARTRRARTRRRGAAARSKGSPGGLSEMGRRR